MTPSDRSHHYILMIAYLFPPLGGSGAIRPLKLAKYLPDYGWIPVVHTVKNPDWYYARDPDLIRELPEDVVITRSHMFKSSWIYSALNPLRSRVMDRFIRRFLLHPDSQVGWLPLACLTALKLVKRYPIKAIYSTSGPLTNHLIAQFVKSRTGLPWVAEFRDEWLEDPALNLPTRHHYRMHYHLEQGIVRKADRVVVMAPAFGDFLAKHVTDTEKFLWLPAGYDAAEFVMPQPSKQSTVFRLVFTGLFYNSFRPNSLLAAVNRLISQGDIPREKIRICFVGANTIADLDVPDDYRVCEFTGFLSRVKALEQLARADMALLLLSRERGSGVIPSKLFDYLAAGRPILALVPPEGAAAGLIRDTRAGEVVDFNDQAGIQSAVSRYFHQWLKDGRVLTETDPEVVQQYTLKSLVKTLADHLDQLARK
ncbi:MAG: glycosyltransferase [Thermodesulfobacteriota bacterium]